MEETKNISDSNNQKRNSLKVNYESKSLSILSMCEKNEFCVPKVHQKMKNSCTLNYKAE